ncbi:MAG: T9SS type A sorting domain-containing protein [Phaeodactylibacter sp.]|nr:T9SS type A sorting domain-containing protein [Phaeodactylibacter sp.]
MAKLYLFLTAFFVVAQLGLDAQNNIWNNSSGDGLWSTNNNWSMGVAPTSSHNAVFNNTSDANCTIDVSPVVKSLDVNSNYDGTISLGSNTLETAGNFVVAAASNFDGGTGKVIVTDAATVNSAASVYDFEINTAQNTDNLSINQAFSINHDLTITQVNNLNGDDLRVGNAIYISDPGLTGNAYISAASASATITGNPLRRLKVEAAASLELLSDITLDNGFTLAGSGAITGNYKIILGGDADGTLDFSGNVAADVEINFSNPNKNAAISQPFNMTGNLIITQVNNLSGNSEIRVAGDITVNDPEVTGSSTSFVVATGNGNLSGTGALRRLKVEGGASLQLTSDFTLNNDFSLTGDGNITGANKLIFGSGGTVNFSGSIPNLEINTAMAGQDVTFSQTFHITGNLLVTQVGSLFGGGYQLRAGGNISITDSAINGSAGNSISLVLAGSGASSFQGAGNGSYKYLAVDKDNATDEVQLSSSDIFIAIDVTQGILNLNGQSPTANMNIHSGGTLSGNGMVDGGLACEANGVIRPGNSIGALTITGDFTNDGMLEIEVTAITSDVINVSGSATVNGTIQLIFTFVPMLNTNYSYTVIAGAGSYINSPAITLSPAHMLNGGFPTYANGMVTVNLSVLPISLVSFSGRQEGTVASLTWRTASEHDNDYMAVERSADGRSFIEIGRVPGAGYTLTPQNYRFVDENPQAGLNYYRLRQVDFDGAATYHGPVSVAFKPRETAGATVSLYPNPAADWLHVSWPSPTRQPVTLKVISLTGRQMALYQAPAGVYTYSLPLTGLQAGSYLLEIRQGAKVESEVFIKH